MDVQVFDVLEAVSQVAEEGVVEMLEHSSFANDVANALGPYNCDTASVGWWWHEGVTPTLILPDVLEGKSQAGVLALDDANLAEGSLADDAQQAEVIEVHCGLVSGWCP